MNYFKHELRFYQEKLLYLYFSSTKMGWKSCNCFFL